jgi:hypothetical protein
MTWMDKVDGIWSRMLDGVNIFLFSNTFNQLHLDPTKYTTFTTEHTRDTNSESRQWGRGQRRKRTTEQQLHNIPNRRPTKQEIWFKDTPEDGARLASKHVG